MLHVTCYALFVHDIKLYHFSYVSSFNFWITAVLVFWLRKQPNKSKCPFVS